ncbi:cytochrome p450 monooxygenase [Fusarium mundagurra]|uniref:Cytochrome p450 monooxygenase n=1 Tax=Fusarium mundagurra TaxID=1567541 RepID=A0A8H6DHB4_9HYPO|nr:cytochrome p450 monooxygenase [Fusarium mundagurra]
MSHLESKRCFTLFIPLVFTLLLTLATAQGDSQPWTPKDPCPTVIHANIPSSYDNPKPFGTYGAVHNAMKTCTNITELELFNNGGDCTEHPDGWNLPFKIDGSDRYRSALHKLSIQTYEFDASEWEDIRPEIGWANEDGTWPVSNSTNFVIRWTTDLFYRSRWHFDRIVYDIQYAIGVTEYSRWRDFGRAQRWYDQRHMSTERLSMDNMQLWLGAMDFSKLHTLSIEDSYRRPKGKGLLVDLPAALTGLETLSIRGRWLSWREYLKQWEDTPGPLPKNKWSSTPPPPARDFILALRPLKNLTWTESGTFQEDVFDPVLKHHGPALKHLEWTNAEYGFRPRPNISDRQLQSLGTWAPGLTSLTIDLERSWASNQLKTIAEGLPELRKLVVYLNLLDEGLLLNGTSSAVRKKHALESVLSVEDGLDMFQTLNSFKVGEMFDTVEFRQGDWAQQSTDG